jgi:hypothetical protein
MLRSWSQAGQDCFVYKILVQGVGIKFGTFLDIGCSQPHIDSNSYLLEEMGWRGLLVDIYDVANDPNHKIREKRSSPFLCADATTLDWRKTLSEYGINSPIDYMSFDIDDGTMQGVLNFPWEKYRAKVITIEHDLYRTGPDIKTLIDTTLLGNGYSMVCENVKHDGKTFEDWFVDPLQIPKNIWEPYVCKDEEYQDIVHTMVHVQGGQRMNIFPK